MILSLSPFVCIYPLFCKCSVGLLWLAFKHYLVPVEVNLSRSRLMLNLLVLVLSCQRRILSMDELVSSLQFLFERVLNHLSHFVDFSTQVF